MSIELNTHSAATVQPQRTVEPVAIRQAPPAAAPNKTTGATAEAASAPPVDMAKMQKELEEAIAQLNEHMKKSNTQLSFSVDNSLNQVVVVVKNEQTGNVIRQLPNEAALRMAHHFEEMRGLLEDHNI